MKEVLNSIFAGIDKEKADLFRDILEKHKAFSKDIKDYEDFYHRLVHPYNSFLEQVINSQMGEQCWYLKELKFLLLNSFYVEQHYLNLIQRYEGRSCSVDKSRSIMRGLTSFFKGNEEIEWDLEQEYTYHIPKKIFTTHKSIITFFDAIKSLHYGRIDKYLVWTKANILPLNQQNNEG